MSALNRTSNGRVPRRSERGPVLLSGSVVTISAYQFLDIVNISSTGAKLSGSRMPKAGVTALFRLQEFTVLCRVVWVTDKQCGVHFEEPLRPALLERFRREGSVAELGDLSPTERIFQEDWKLEIAH